MRHVVVLFLNEAAHVCDWNIRRFCTGRTLGENLKGNAFRKHAHVKGPDALPALCPILWMHACVENLTAFVSPYGATMQAIVRHVNFQQIKCLLLGSPGFVKDDFFEFLNMEAVRREERVRLGYDYCSFIHSRLV